MKRYLFFPIMLFSLFINDASAQDTLSVTSQEVSQTLLAQIDHEVSLSDKQKEKVYALLMERSEKFHQVRSQKRTVSRAKEAYQQANERALNKLRQVLTKEQYEKFVLLRQETKKQKEKYEEAEGYRSEQDIELDF